MISIINVYDKKDFSTGLIPYTDAIQFKVTS